LAAYHNSCYKTRNNCYEVEIKMTSVKASASVTTVSSARSLIGKGSRWIDYRK